MSNETTIETTYATATAARIAMQSRCRELLAADRSPALDIEYRTLSAAWDYALAAWNAAFEAKYN